MADPAPFRSALLSEYVDCEFSNGRGSTLKFVRRALEKKSGGDLRRWRGGVIVLELNRETSQLKVWASVVAEIEPEVVDYDAFKAFVLRDRR